MAGDAENINKLHSLKQARNTRINWLNSPERANWVNDVKNKQAANGLLPSAPGPLHPSRTTSSLIPTVCGKTHSHATFWQGSSSMGRLAASAGWTRRQPEHYLGKHLASQQCWDCPEHADGPQDVPPALGLALTTVELQPSAGVRLYLYVHIYHVSPSMYREPVPSVYHV